MTWIECWGCNRKVEKSKSVLVSIYPYCKTCLTSCELCSEDLPEDQFYDDRSNDSTCNDCTNKYWCEDCAEMVDNAVSDWNCLCRECDLKAHPHSDYTAISSSIEGLKKELASRKIVLVTGVCCGRCSAVEGYDRASKKGWRGYAHYNLQAEDSLRERGGSLHIGFWSVEDNETAAKRVRTSILKALDRVGAWRESHDDIHKAIEVIVPQELTEHGLVELAGVST